MKLDLNRLPDDPDLLREIVAGLASQLEEQERRLARVQHILEILLAWRYGRKSEKIDERHLFLFAVQYEAGGGDAASLHTEHRNGYRHTRRDATRDTRVRATAG